MKINTTHSEKSKKLISMSLKGIKKPFRSEEHRKNLSKSLKGLFSGEKNPNFGKHLSEKTRKKLSKSHKGKKLSEETRRKMSESRKGMKYSEERNRKISDSLKNSIIAKRQIKKLQLRNKGIPLSESHRKKISLSHKGKPISVEIRKKISLGLKGKKSYRWKGGISPINDQIRHSFQYKNWRSQVFIRDNFTCQKCGRVGGKIYSHHKIKSFSQLVQEAKNNLPLFPLYDACMIYSPMWDINNGQTLCFKCHEKTKNYLNRWKNAPKEYPKEMNQ